MARLELVSWNTDHVDDTTKIHVHGDHRDLQDLRETLESVLKSLTYYHLVIS
jgi:hypothetical protein